LLNEKITLKWAKIAKNAKRRKKVPQKGPNGLFERFLSTLPPY
jgi:hypothetical protein